MVTPEEALNSAHRVMYECGDKASHAAKALTDLVSQVERLEAQRKQLREALKITRDVLNRNGYETRLMDTALKDTE